MINRYICLTQGNFPIYCLKPLTLSYYSLFKLPPLFPLSFPPSLTPSLSLLLVYCNQLLSLPPPLFISLFLWYFIHIPWLCWLISVIGENDKPILLPKVNISYDKMTTWKYVSAFFYTAHTRDLRFSNNMPFLYTYHIIIVSIYALRLLILLPRL